MTPHQFASIVGADEQWVHNAARLLGRRFRHTLREARWLRLVYLLHEGFAMSLAAAAQAATRALALPPSARHAEVATSLDGSAWIVIDLARYHSSFAAAVGAALEFDTPRRRGRRPEQHRHDPLTAARDFGVDLSLLRASLTLTPAQRLERLDENAAFIEAVRKRTMHHVKRSV